MEIFKFFVVFSAIFCVGYIFKYCCDKEDAWEAERHREYNKEEFERYNDNE